MSGLADSPAYPGEMEIQNPDGPNIRVPVPGMTYRQWVAGQALIGMPMDWTAEDCANAARERADALIAALEGTPASSGEPAAKPEPKPQK